MAQETIDLPDKRNLINILEQITPYETRSLPIGSLVFGVQEYPCEQNSFQGEYTESRVLGIARAMRNGARIGTDLPRPKIVLLEGSPIVIDGHHTIRACGIFNSRTKGDKLNEIPVELYNSEEFCSVLGGGDISIGKTVLIQFVNLDKSSLEAHLHRKWLEAPHKKLKKLDYKTFVPGILEC
jgi:hypothetical protein